MQTDGGKVETVTDFIFLGSKITAVTAAMKLKDACSLEGKLWPTLDSVLKSKHITLLTKVWLVKNYDFSSSLVRMWQLYHKEGWVLKNWCFQIVVLEKTLESPLDCKEIKPVNRKGNQPQIFIRRTNAKAPILWLPEVQSWRNGKDPDAGKEWGEEEKGVTEDKIGWIISLTQWTLSSGRQWWTGKPGMLQSMGSQRAGLIHWREKKKPTDSLTVWWPIHANKRQSHFHWLQTTCKAVRCTIIYEKDYRYL